MLTFNPEPFAVVPALVTWLAVLAAFVVVAVLAAAAVGLIAGGFSGMRRAVAGLGYGVVDLLRVSPGRVAAITQLTFREAIRRKALLVFVLFALLFMFGGWFLAGSEQRAAEQVRVFVGFVLLTITLLILPLALLLSCWGIPEDIRRRSLHTVVTKPVRRSEVVLGRILGYVGVNTVVLVVMGVVGYVWIQRQVPPEAEAELVSRVPIFGRLGFFDTEGKPSQGKNVGDIWQHRSYVMGGSREKGVYVFDGITPAALTRAKDEATGAASEVLRLESTFEAFRTVKGDMKRGLYFQLAYANPDDPEKTRVVDPEIFEIKEFQNNVRYLPRKLTVYDEDGASREVDLFENLVGPGGRLQVEVSALDGGQYLGMAPADLFVRTPDRPFAFGYFKAVLGIWLMTVLVVVLGVTASTFAKGPVATILTLTLLVIGSPFRGFMDKLAGDYEKAVRGGAVVEGGGPIESVIRIVGHMNPTTALPDTALTGVVRGVDQVFLGGVWAVRYVIPDFGAYDLADYPANGYDVFWTTRPGLLPAIGVTLAFLIPCLLIGYYSLRFRELEVK